MSGILILSYKLREVTNSYVLPCFELLRILPISATKCPIEMGFGSKCSILNRQVIYIEKSKLNIANMWLIPLDCVTIMESGLESTGIAILYVLLHTFQLYVKAYIKTFMWPDCFTCSLHNKQLSSKGKNSWNITFLYHVLCMETFAWDFTYGPFPL